METIKKDLFPFPSFPSEPSPLPDPASSTHAADPSALAPSAHGVRSHVGRSATACTSPPTRAHKNRPTASAAAPLGQLTPTSPPLSPISAALAACRVSPSRSPLSLHQAHRRTDVGHEPPSQDLRLLGNCRVHSPPCRSSVKPLPRHSPSRSVSRLRSVSKLQGIKDRALATKRSSFLRSTTLNTLSICLMKVAFGAIYAQVKKKASRRISRSSRASTSSRIRLATSPQSAACGGFIYVGYVSILCTLILLCK
ncbi:uncharacterized protein [Zea mays]|uniref:uncharacterized protein n=1 Tax=Zea mays TaxID=4577 RepID=UPI001651BCBD|nr:uncharacterized protein LOC118472310 [Zea mays]